METLVIHDAHKSQKGSQVKRGKANFEYFNRKLASEPIPPLDLQDPEKVMPTKAFGTVNCFVTRTGAKHHDSETFRAYAEATSGEDASKHLDFAICFFNLLLL